MAFMNVAPKPAPAPGVAGPIRPSTGQKPPATPPSKPSVKRKPNRGNIGRMLREKMG
jgi:hypothetical protein